MSKRSFKELSLSEMSLRKLVGTTFNFHSLVPNTLTLNTPNDYDRLVSHVITKLGEPTVKRDDGSSVWWFNDASVTLRSGGTDGWDLCLTKHIEYETFCKYENIIEKQLNVQVKDDFTITNVIFITVYYLTFLSDGL